jgi:chemotaxis protein histidine kinase CheA
VYRRRQVESVDFGTPFVPAPVEPIAPVEPAKAATPAEEPLTQAATPDHPDLSPRRSPVRTAPSPGLPIRRSPRVSKVSVMVEDVDELSPDRQESSRLIQQDEFSEVERHDEEEAETIDDNEAIKYLRWPSKRKSSPLDVDLEVQAEEEPEQEQEEEIELEEDDEPSLIEPTPPEKPPRGRKPKAKGSPAAQRQPKKPKAKPKAKAKSASTKPRDRKSGETIPVVVHRLTRPFVYDEDDTDADVLNEDVPFAKRSGVNAVDVLSQFCDEVIESGLTALEEGGSTAEDAATRREYNTKLRAVEAFGEELRTRLLELVCTPLAYIPTNIPNHLYLAVTNIPRLLCLIQTIILTSVYEPHRKRKFNCEKAFSPSGLNANKSLYVWTKYESSMKTAVKKLRTKQHSTHRFMTSSSPFPFGKKDLLVLVPRKS